MVSLPRSLRVRLQLWHALILLCVVLSFGSLLYHQVVIARWDEIDSGLMTAARVLESALRDIPRPFLDSQSNSPQSNSPQSNSPQSNSPQSNSPQSNSSQSNSPQSNQSLSTGPQSASPNSAALMPRGGPRFPWEVAQARLDNAWEHGIQLPRRLPLQMADPAGPAYYLIWRRDGSVLKEQDVPYALRNRPMDPRLQPIRMVHERGIGPLREVFVRGAGDTLICVGRPVGGEVQRMWTLAAQLILASASILVAGLCGGWWLSRSAVEPIQRMTHTAESINSTNLSQRIDLHNIDLELEQLGQVLNAMLSRLEQSFETQRRFAADASHELRTPLATILSTIELSLSKPRQPAEYQQQFLKCQRAAKRMHDLVSSLLQLTRSDAGAARPALDQLDLALIVEETVESLHDEAVAVGLTITCQITTTPVRGHAGELTQVVTNLVQNAIAYNRPGGRIQVSLQRESDQAVLRVCDTGIGIEPEHLPHIFERFYRADRSRGQTAGHGLGLAICHCIVEQHGGSITVSSQPGQGSEFVVRLPADTQAQA